MVLATLVMAIVCTLLLLVDVALTAFAAWSADRSRRASVAVLEALGRVEAAVANSDASGERMRGLLSQVLMQQGADAALAGASGPVSDYQKWWAVQEQTEAARGLDACDPDYRRAQLDPTYRAVLEEVNAVA